MAPDREKGILVVSIHQDEESQESEIERVPDFPGTRPRASPEYHGKSLHQLQKGLHGGAAFRAGLIRG